MNEKRVELASYAISVLIVGLILGSFGMSAVAKMNLAMVTVGPLVCGPALFLLRTKNSAIYGLFVILVTLATSASFFYKWETFSMIATYYALCAGIIRAMDDIEKKLKGTRHEAAWRHVFSGGA